MLWGSLVLACFSMLAGIILSGLGCPQVYPADEKYQMTPVRMQQEPELAKG